MRGWLIFMLLANAWNIYRTYVVIEDLVSHADPRWNADLWWALPTLMGLGVANIVGIALLLLALRAALFLVAAVTVAGLGVEIYLRVAAGPLLLGVLGFVILVLLVRPRWQFLR